MIGRCHRRCSALVWCSATPRSSLRDHTMALHATAVPTSLSSARLSAHTLSARSLVVRADPRSETAEEWRAPCASEGRWEGNPN